MKTADAVKDGMEARIMIDGKPRPFTVGELMRALSGAAGSAKLRIMSDPEGNQEGGLLGVERKGDTYTLWPGWQEEPGGGV